MTKASRILLFMPAGGSLEAWERDGRLAHELALYQKVAAHGWRVGIVSWGGRKDREIAAKFPWLTIYGNFLNLETGRYERLMPLLHMLPLIRADVIQCMRGEDNAAALRCALFWRKVFVARSEYAWDKEYPKACPRPLESAVNQHMAVLARSDKIAVSTESDARRLARLLGRRLDDVVCIPEYAPTSPLPELPVQESKAVDEQCLETALKAEWRLLCSFPRLAPPQKYALAMRALAGYFKRKSKALLCRHPGFSQNIYERPIKTLLKRLDDKSAEETLHVLDTLEERLLPRLSEDQFIAWSAERLEKQFATKSPDSIRRLLGAADERLFLSLPDAHAIACMDDRMVGRFAEKGPELARALLGTVDERLFSSLPDAHAIACMDDRMVGRFAEKGPELARALLGAVDERLFLPLPDDDAIACTEERISKQITSRAPNEALRILFATEQHIYEKEEKLAALFDGGAHARCREFFVRRLQADEKVLCIGCDIAPLAAEVAESAMARVTAVELGEESGQAAECAAEYPSVRLLPKDALASSRHADFDSIILSHALEHIPRRAAFLKGLMEGIRPKRVLLRVPFAERDWRVPVRRDLGTEWRLDRRHQTEYSHEGLLCELGRAGLFVTGHETRWGEICCEADGAVRYARSAAMDGPITVLMASHNDEAHIVEAVHSILRQTMRDFTFLIVNDASTDGTAALLEDLAGKDARIRVLANTRNIGLTASLNRGLKEVRSPYVARMDADDIALPERLARQLAYMEKHPELAAVGCSVARFMEEDPDAAPVLWLPPLAPGTIRRESFRIAPQLSHPGAMLRMDALRSVGGYRECFAVTQDYDLWLRLLENYDLGNVSDVLLLYRYHQKTASCARSTEQAVSHVLAMQSSEHRRQGKEDPLEKRAVSLELMQSLLDPSQCSCYSWVRLLATRDIRDKEALLARALALIMPYELKNASGEGMKLERYLKRHEFEELRRIVCDSREQYDADAYHVLLEYLQGAKAAHEERPACREMRDTKRIGQGAPEARDLRSGKA